MHVRMVDLLRHRATPAERKLTERIKAPIFLEAILAIDIMLESQSNLAKEVNPSILKDDISS